LNPLGGLDESSPSRGKPNIRHYREVVKRILLSLPERFSGLKIDFYLFISAHLHVLFIFDGMKEGLPYIVRTFKALVTRDTCPPSQAQARRAGRSSILAEQLL